MDTLKFTIGGALAPSYRGALAQAEAEALRANATLQGKIRAQQMRLAAMDKAYLGAGPGSAAASAIAMQQYPARMKMEMELQKMQLKYNLLGSAAVRKAEAEKVAAAAAADAERVVLNRAAMDTIIAQERETAIAQSAIQDAQVAAMAQAEAEKVAIQKAADIAMINSFAKAAAVRSGGGASGISGVVRESLSIGREIAAGRGIGRIGSSLTLLIQYLRNVVTGANKAADAAKVVVDVYERAAVAAAVKANASLKVAAASASEFGAEEAVVKADQEKADADLAVAVAARTKANAAALAAESEAAEAAATQAAAESSFFAVTGVGLLAAALAAVAIAAAFAYEKLRGYAEALKEADFQLPDLKTDYVPILERHVSDAKNTQRELTKEVLKTVDAYYSAAEASKRVADATREHYEHARKMLEIQKQTALDKATTPAAKLKVEKEYSDKEIALDAQQRQQELIDKFNSKKLYEQNSRRRLTDAANIHVNTKAEDESIAGQLNQNKEAAEAFLKGGSFWQHFKEGAAVLLGGNPLAMKERQQAILDMEQGGKDRAQEAVKRANEFADKKTQNDILREKKSSMTGEGIKDAAEAVKLGLEIKDDAKTNAQKNKDEAEEAAARLAEEKAKIRLPGRIQEGEMEKAGLFASAGAVRVHSVLEKSLMVQQKIEHNTRPAPHHAAHSGTAYE